MRFDQAIGAKRARARIGATARRKPKWQKIPRLDEAVLVQVPAERTIEFDGYDH
jgi:hypothetical protein